MYINDRIAKQCCQINHNLFKCQSVLWVNIMNTFILGTLYVPCQSSPHYNPDFFEDLALDMAHIQENYDLPFMIIGDFNSRTGTLNEIMMSETDDIIFDSSNFKYPDVLDIMKSLNIPFERSSKARIKNNNGRNLIDMCKCQELCIVNGRMGTDKGIGCTTYDDKTVIDYVLCTPDLLAKVSDFKVDKFDPLLSDKHNPLNVYLNLDKVLYPKCATDITHSINENIDNNHIKCKWENEKTNDYQNNFEMDKIHDILLYISSINPNEVTVDTINQISDNLRDILINPAKVTGMHKQISCKATKKHTTTKQPWFNSICKESKINF